MKTFNVESKVFKKLQELFENNSSVYKFLQEVEDNRWLKSGIPHPNTLARWFLQNKDFGNDSFSEYIVINPKPLKYVIVLYKWNSEGERIKQAYFTKEHTFNTSVAFAWTFDDKKTAENVVKTMPSLNVHVEEKN